MVVVFLLAEYENSHREYERKLEAARLQHDEDIFKLKQENFVLSAKVNAVTYMNNSGPSTAQ